MEFAQTAWRFGLMTPAESHRREFFVAHMNPLRRLLRRPLKPAPVENAELEASRRENQRLEKRIEELVRELGPAMQRNAVLQFKLHELTRRNKVLEIREPALRASLEQAHRTIRRLNEEIAALRGEGAA